MFKFLLVLPDGEPHDPAVFVTAVPNWTVDEVIVIGDGETLRILGIETEIDNELIERALQRRIHRRAGMNPAWRHTRCGDEGRLTATARRRYRARTR